MKISVSSYSFSQYLSKGEMTLEDTVKKAKEMGFDAIEFTDLNGSTHEENLAIAKKLRETADEAEIEINAYTVRGVLYQDTQEEIDREVERLKGQLDIAKILGAPIMRHDVCPKLAKSGKRRSFELMLPTIAENVRRVTEYAKSLGIKTCTENHGYVAQDSYRVEKLFNAVAHDNYGLLVDMGNFLCVDEDPQTAVSRLAPYAFHVHAKDFIVTDEPVTGSFMSRGGNYLRGAVIGEGVVPIKKCLRILKNVNYDGYLSIEYEGKEDSLTGIERGLLNLKRILAQI